MEMILKNGFSEMNQKEIQEIEGGSGILIPIENFLINRLIYTNANYQYHNIYKPINGSNDIVCC